MYVGGEPQGSHSICFLCQIELDDLIATLTTRLGRTVIPEAARSRSLRARLLNVDRLNGDLGGVSDMWGVFFVLLPFAVILLWHSLDRVPDRRM